MNGTTCGCGRPAPASPTPPECIACLIHRVAVELTADQETEERSRVS